MWTALMGLCIITWHISISKWAEAGSQNWLSRESISGCGQEPGVLLKLHTTGFEFAIGVDAPVSNTAQWKSHRKPKWKGCEHTRRTLIWKVWMSINKPEAALPQISEPADQEGVPLSHCCYLKSVLHSLWKHANPSKIHATSIFVKIPVVSIQENFLVWPSLIPDFYSLYIYHSRQVWNSYPM